MDRLSGKGEVLRWARVSPTPSFFLFLEPLRVYNVYATQYRSIGLNQRINKRPSAARVVMRTRLMIIENVLRLSRGATFDRVDGEVAIHANLRNERTCCSFCSNLFTFSRLLRSWSRKCRSCHLIKLIILGIFLTLFFFLLLIKIMLSSFSGFAIYKTLKYF